MTADTSENGWSPSTLPDASSWLGQAVTSDRKRLQREAQQSKVVGRSKMTTTMTRCTSSSARGHLSSFRNERTLSPPVSEQKGRQMSQQPRVASQMDQTSASANMM